MAQLLTNTNLNLEENVCTYISVNNINYELTLSNEWHWIK